jgi:putative ABC transport system permease protein
VQTGRIDQPVSVLTVTLADLRMRARQFAIAVVGATLVFAMALVMSGLAQGFRAEPARMVAAIGADSYVVRAGNGGPFSSPADLRPSTLGTIRHTPGVTVADPLVIVPSQNVATAQGPLYAHLIGVLPTGMGAPHATSGRGLQQPGDAVVDRLTHLKLGDRFVIGSVHFHVVGMVSGMTYFAGAPAIFLPLTDAQQILFGGRPDMTSIAVRGTPSVVPTGLQVMTPAQVRDDMTTPLKNGIGSIEMVRDFLWCVAIVIIGAVVYLSALERRRDFAVLKAIGSSTQWLYSGMAVQATIMALLSGLLAIAIEPLLAGLIPLQLAVTFQARAILPVVALVIGVVSSLAGLRQVVRAARSSRPRR